MVFSCCRCIIKLILTLAIVVGIILAAIFIGASVQKGQAKRAPDISPKYSSASVCAFKRDTNSTSNMTTFKFETYVSDGQAIAANATVGQCGECGQCSNMQDYKVLASSSASEFYEKLGYCGLRAIAGGSYVSNCLKTSTEYPNSLTKDLTPGCTDCFTKLVSCGLKKCGFSCVAASVLQQSWLQGSLKQVQRVTSGNSTKNFTDATLNDCLYCTDQLCTPALLTCAGANKQRLNIPSLSGINKNQYCNTTKVDWATYKF